MARSLVRVFVLKEFQEKKKGVFLHVEPKMPFFAQFPCFMERQVNLPIQ